MNTAASAPRTVVVGVDSSPEAAKALDWARRLSRPDDRIVVVRAWAMPVMVSSWAPEAIFPYDFEQIAKESLEELVAAAGDDRLAPVVRAGHPGRSIVDEAAAVDADLIVVGHRGDSRVSLVLGSTASYVLHHAECPVAVVRGDRDPDDIRTVVVGIDAHDIAVSGDNESVRALTWAYGLASVEQIRALHGWFVPPLAIGVFPAAAIDPDDMDEAAAEVVARAIAAAGDPPDGVDVVPQVVRSPGGRALIAASETADLVVVGSRGRGGFAELLLGSTSSEVAAHSATSVVVVR